MTLNTAEQKTVSRIFEHQKEMPFAAFMHAALYTPGLGYYTNGTTKFGRAGDFTTAPELSVLFSQTLAQQCREILSDHPGDILELGAGNGKMAAAILQTLAAQNALPKTYYILEASTELQHRQQALIKAEAPHLFSSVQWLSALPKTFTGIMLGNEVLDALPVHAFVIEQDAIQEKWVAFDGKALTWQAYPADEILTQAVKQAIPDFSDLPQPYHSEIHLALPSFLQDLSQCLQSGVILWIDYGFPAREYYHPQRHMGTLMCHHKHRTHDNPLIQVTQQDITAHINFTEVARHALAAGFEILGYTTQASFLLSLGLLDHLPKAQDNKTQYTQQQAVHMLTSPAEMGELFKVMALGKQMSTPLQGFAFSDQSHRL